MAASPSPTGPARRPGATPEQVARAYVVCREVFDLAGFVRRVEATDNVVSTAAQTALYLEFRRLIDRSVRWFLTSRPASLDIAAEVARFRPGIEAFSGRIGELLQGSERTRLQRRARELEGKGVPEELALAAASLLDLYSLLDCIEIAEDTGEKLDDVVGVYFLTSETFSIDAMLTRVTMLPRDDRWDAMARGALRDDLYAVLESLTRSVLEVSNARHDAAARLAEWSELNADALGRAKGRARRDRADEPRRHRRALGRPAHAAHRDEAGRLRPRVPGPRCHRQPVTGRLPRSPPRRPPRSPRRRRLRPRPRRRGRPQPRRRPPGRRHQDGGTKKAAPKKSA